jgi:O-antigen ligase
VALLGLPAGLAVSALLVVRPPTRRAGLALLAAASVGAVLLVSSGAVSSAVAEVAEMRAHTGSPARVDATRAALDIVAQRPMTGVGPGDGWVRWSSDDGTAQTMQYVHDEYLQVLVELGAPGLALLLGIGAGGLVMVRRAARRDPGSTVPAAVGAAMAAAAVHGAFDFVWHVPVVPLVLAVLLGLLAERAHDTPPGRPVRATHQRGDQS